MTVPAEPAVAFAGVGAAASPAVVRVPLRPGDGGEERWAVVRALAGADEVALATDDAGSARWVTGALARAVESLGSEPVDAEALRALTIGDRNALLLGVVAATYGPRLSWVLGCSSCGEPLDADLDVRDILAGARTSGPQSSAGWRLPTGADLEAVAGLADPAEARAALIAACVGGHDVGDAELAAVEAEMAAADPLADVELVVDCVGCGAALPAALDPALELADRLAGWPELLADVHALALAYGWTEPAVLALPRPRRRQYLALLADGDE